MKMLLADIMELSAAFGYWLKFLSLLIISNSEIAKVRYLALRSRQCNCIIIFWLGNSFHKFYTHLTPHFLHKTYGIGVTTEKSLILNCSVRQTSNLTTLHTFNTPFLHKTYGIGVTTEKSLILNFSVRQTSKINLHIFSSENVCKFNNFTHTLHTIFT